MNLKCEFSLQFFLMKLNQLMFSFHPFNSNFSYTHVQFSMSRDDATILYSFSINSYHWLHLFFWMVLSRVWRCIMTTSHCRCFHISLHLSGEQRNITIEKNCFVHYCVSAINISIFVCEFTGRAVLRRLHLVSFNLHVVPNKDKKLAKVLMNVSNCIMTCLCCHRRASQIALKLFDA